VSTQAFLNDAEKRFYVSGYYSGGSGGSGGVVFAIEVLEGTVSPALAKSEPPSTAPSVSPPPSASQKPPRKSATLQSKMRSAPCVAKRNLHSRVLFLARFSISKWITGPITRRVLLKGELSNTSPKTASLSSVSHPHSYQTF
jgi:hypothetical protein